MPKRKQPVTIASSKQSSPYGPPAIASGKAKALKRRAATARGKA